MQYWTSSTFGILSRPLTVTHPDASVGTMAYPGLATAMTNALGQHMTEYKNPMANGQSDWIEDPIPSTAGQLTSASRARFDLVFDGLDRLYRMYLPSASKGLPSLSDYEEYGYDSNANHTSLRRRSGQVITMAYDALNQETTRTVPDNPAVAGNYARTLTNRRSYVAQDIDNVEREIWAGTL